MAEVTVDKELDDLEQASQYAIICFLPKKDDGSWEIDLVPYSWLDHDGDKLLCAYPNTKKDLKKRDEYLKNLSPPKDRWPRCEIEIISCADTLEKGQRRLKRAEITRKVETETSDSSSKNRQDSSLSNVIVLENNEIINELRHVESMGSIASQSTDSRLKKNKRDKSLNVKEVDSTIQGEHENQQGMVTNINYDDILFDCIKAYVDEKFQELYEKLDAFKISTEYVVKNETKKVKTQVLMKSGENVPKMTKVTAMEPFKDMFPINNKVQFFIFDSELENDSEKNKLKNLFRVIMYGESDIAIIIRKTLSEVITPLVQLDYSGTGRRVHGIGKKNFSATYTYNCLKEVVEEKFGDSDQSKSLRVKLGNFLANAGDRNGGRRQRAINTDNNINNNNNKDNNNSQ
ncbi:uncharacterized protein LOC141525755 isoform X1 [Cotesia typhae]|uniref:uncharacterized protein LOC141525755 isoform X1 n=1 Tax=Cotesia typhae TaxID=2053667 RepID=UPI003D68BE69